MATATAERAGAETSAAEATGLRTVSAVDGATLAADPPEGLVVLDIRTPAEFASGHLAHATMIDFYQADFADRLAQLDPNAPYLLYCNSGNRSAEALTMMSGLGFTDVTEIDGGIQAWLTNGLAVTIP